MSLLATITTTLLLTAATAGEIHGQAAGATSVIAIDRATGTRYPAQLTDGAFVVSGLPLVKKEKTDDGEATQTGGQYDLVIDYPGVRLEGVNLHVKHSDFVEEQPMPEGGRERVVEIMKQLSKFEDTFQVLAVEGNIQHAVVFVSKLRTRPFYNSKPGEVTWRVEVWHFLRVRPEEPEDAWIKSPDELGILHYRERLPKEAFEKKALAFDPALGGLELTEAAPRRDLGAIVAPEAKAGIRLRDSRKPMK